MADSNSKENILFVKWDRVYSPRISFNKENNLNPSTNKDKDNKSKSSLRNRILKSLNSFNHENSSTNKDNKVMKAITSLKQKIKSEKPLKRLTPATPSPFRSKNFLRSASVNSSIIMNVEQLPKMKEIEMYSPFTINTPVARQRNKTKMGTGIDTKCFFNSPDSVCSLAFDLQAFTNLSDESTTPLSKKRRSNIRTVPKYRKSLKSKKNLFA